MTKMSLGKKLFISYVLAAAVPAIVIALFCFRISSSAQNQLVDESLFAFKNGVDRDVAASRKAITAYGAIISSDEEVGAAVDEGNVDYLVAYSKAIVENRNADVDYLVFADAQAQVVARGNDRQKSADLSARAGVRAALGGSPSVGIEKTQVSPIDLRGSFPIFHKGQVVGCAVLGKDLANETFVDPVKAAFDVEVTLFSGDERVMTTIVNNGKRAIGTKMTNPRVIEEVLTGGRVFRDVNVILGATYKTIYWPILGGDNKPLGMYFIGKPMNIVEAAESRQLWTVAVLVAVVFVVMLVVAGLITGSIVKPLTRAVNRLTAASATVREASDAISGSCSALVDISSEQASAMEESAAAVEEMSSMARKNADTAGEAGKLMSDTRTAAEGASGAMQSMVSTMDEIKKSSEEISGIIKTIQDISFQTNLLALNAAVEAARAGEHGKGFAVVADEVRNLAQRAGEAARNTSSIIETSVSVSNRGAKEVSEAANWIEGTRTNADSVARLVQSVGEASEEQSKGIDQLNDAINNMDKGTQQVAENSDEVAGSARNLTEQSAEMENVVQDIAKLIGIKLPEASAGPAIVAARKAPGGPRAGNMKMLPPPSRHF